MVSKLCAFFDWISEPNNLTAISTLRAEITSEWRASDAAAGERTGIICYCLGWIAYWDESGQRRETGFCLKAKFSNDGDRWVSAGKPEHEYEY